MHNARGLGPHGVCVGGSNRSGDPTALVCTRESAHLEALRGGPEQLVQEGCQLGVEGTKDRRTSKTHRLELGIAHEFEAHPGIERGCAEKVASTEAGTERKEETGEWGTEGTERARAVPETGDPAKKHPDHRAADDALKVRGLVDAVGVAGLVAGDDVVHTEKLSKGEEDAGVPGQDGDAPIWR
ncbi:hypothetical protein B0H17DRAFT_1133371 [Mycena rosella]|uniref:Uncharacterized protein n=1 Tax=Mycena rosella TaxID=1033263 RepID=A0AAD7DL80_MYCRO|nr:hypothetical protein B0H17DRAFT_1133371 [Mycena rosella]